MRRMRQVERGLSGEKGDGGGVWRRVPIPGQGQA